MQKLNLFQGGHPFQVDDLSVLQAGVIDALKGVCDGLGNGQTAYILKGVVSSGLTITAGYIYFQGEVFPVDAQSIPVGTIGQSKYWVIQEATLAPSPVTYQNTISRIVHVRRRMVQTVASSPPANSILASDLVRLNQVLGLTPQGGIIMYSGSSSNFTSTGLGKPNTPVHGWALANGNTQSIPGGGTFTTPNLRGKFIVGFDERTSGADADYSTIGNTGGEKAHELTKAEIPPHKHAAATDGADINITHSGSHSTSSQTRTVNSGSGATGVLAPQWADGLLTLNSPPDGSHIHANSYFAGSVGNGTADGVGVGGTGGKGLAHENRPPYFTLAYIVKLL